MGLRLKNVTIKRWEAQHLASSPASKQADGRINRTERTNLDEATTVPHINLEGTSSMSSAPKIDVCNQITKAVNTYLTDKPLPKPYRLMLTAQQQLAATNIGVESYNPPVSPPPDEPIPITVATSLPSNVTGATADRCYISLHRGLSKGKNPDGESSPDGDCGNHSPGEGGGGMGPGPRIPVPGSGDNKGKFGVSGGGCWNPGERSG
ncbi:unnamed protein product [Triticum turgidum subsp. durum]|uniref:Uncharacterized protein n=1 Tax=Triticum turgidum subsp. durum TaxID=4567 RepID=A0A9R0UYJ5_TRITD|nr:unnamed protein product [Triticum turgidum subsp. durum]